MWVFTDPQNSFIFLKTVVVDHNLFLLLIVSCSSDQRGQKLCK